MLVSTLQDTMQTLIRTLESTMGSNPTRTTQLSEAALDTGMPALDRQSAFLFQGEITAISGRPGIGKSALVCQWARHASAIRRQPVVYFTLGESRLRVTRTMLSGQCHIDHRRLFTAQFDDNTWDALAVGLGVLHEAKIWIVDSRLSAHDIYGAMTSSTWQGSMGAPGLMVVDNFESLAFGRHGTDRTDVLTEAMRVLKDLAVEYAMPVALVSQHLHCLRHHDNALSDSATQDMILAKADTTFRLEHCAASVGPGSITATWSRHGVRRNADLHFIQQLRCFSDVSPP